MIEKIIPILDNFHLAKKKERHISDLAEFPSVVIIVDDLFSLDLTKDKLLNEYDHYKIKEYSPTLRNKIIEKWMRLSDDSTSSNEDYGILDKKSELVENSLGKIIGSGIMPAYPFFILTIISTSETLEKPLNEEITSQGHCYQALIYLYLRKQSVKDEDFGTYINFLTEFSYFFYKKKQKEISKDDFNIFFEQYEKQYNLPVAKEVLLNKLSKIQIISLDSFNNYSFCYLYLYYFFVAKYLAENTNSFGEINDIVDDLIDNLHKHENAYILTFMSHHSKNYPLLDKLLVSANNLYEFHSPSTLCTEELSFFDKRVNELVSAVLPNGEKSTKKERLNALQAREEREEREEYIDSDQEADNKTEINEYSLTLRKSIKTVEVMGHIIKNRAGSLKRNKLEEIFSSAMDVSLRIIHEFITIIEKEENHEGILKFLEGRVKEVMKKNGQKEFSKAEISKITVKLFWNMNFFLICTLINKTIHSLGSDRLIDIINTVCNEKNTPASFLINHGILMWYKKNVQVDNIVKKVNEDSFSPTSKRILDFMVVNHCLLHNINSRDIQKIEKKLDIPAKRLKPPLNLKLT